MGNCIHRRELSGKRRGLNTAICPKKNHFPYYLIAGGVFYFWHYMCNYSKKKKKKKKDLKGGVFK